MVSGSAPVCLRCKHFLQGEQEDPDRGLYCVAFPGGIPDPIVFSDHDHSTPFPGDHGVQFEEKSSEANRS